MTEKKSSKKLHQAHDSFAKFALSHKKVVRSILKHSMPELIQKSIDLKTLKPYPTEHIKSSLHSCSVDIVYTAKRTKSTKESDNCYCILHFEQETNPKADLPLRIIEYKCQLIRHHLRQHPGTSWPPCLYRINPQWT